MSTDRLVFRLVLLAVLLSSLPAYAQTRDTVQDTCDFIPLAAGEVWRSAGPAAGAAQCFEISDAIGVLTFDVSVPGYADVEPRLVAVDAGCRVIRPRRAITEGASWLALPAAGGAYRFCVSAQDPQRALGDWNVVTAAVDSASPAPTKNEDDGESGEYEIPPGGLTAGPISSSLCPLGGSKGERHGAASADDHGDTFFCATDGPLGGIEGRIVNTFGDDRDVFRITVRSPMTLELATHGPTDTFGTLYNSRGERLLTDDDGGAGGNFRLVKTLLPGLYYLRIEGARGAEGAYRLRITKSNNN